MGQYGLYMLVQVTGAPGPAPHRSPVRRVPRFTGQPAGWTMTLGDTFGGAHEHPK